MVEARYRLASTNVPSSPMSDQPSENREQCCDTQKLVILLLTVPHFSVLANCIYGYLRTYAEGILTCITS